MFLYEGKEKHNTDRFRERYREIHQATAEQKSPDCSRCHILLNCLSASGGSGSPQSVRPWKYPSSRSSRRFNEWSILTDCSNSKGTPSALWSLDFCNTPARYKNVSSVKLRFDAVQDFCFKTVNTAWYQMKQRVHLHVSWPSCSKWEGKNSRTDWLSCLLAR